MECAQVPNFISRGSEAAAPRAGRSSLPDTGITAAPIPAPRHCGDDPMQGPEVQGDEANCRLASSRSLGFQLKQSERLDKQSVYVAVTIISSSSAEILRHAS
uniref:Uncharacterized protein n=1 Tax=Mesocestoides corti TaxID=53468 RepID=A0A5K3FTU5_MESCO